KAIKLVKLLYSFTILYYNIRPHNFLLNNRLRFKIINFFKLAVNGSYIKINPST
ncbi:hypothetical protein CTAM01_17056, partial [Colletotrichum tamarilloi]